MMELSNGSGNLAFAEHQNLHFLSNRGNRIITGVGVTPQGSPDLTVNVATGDIVAGGVKVNVAVAATYAGTPITFATAQGGLTSGQAVFSMIHVDSSGVITNTQGTPTLAGQQYPPPLPDDQVMLAMITLSEGDTTIDSVDIEDWRVNVSKGEYIAGPLEIIGLSTLAASTFGSTVNMTGIAGAAGLGFLARHSTGGAITYRTFANVLTDLGIVFGIADTNVTKVDGSASDNQLAEFTANGLVGRNIGIVDTNIVRADGAPVSGQLGQWTANGQVGRAIGLAINNVIKVDATNALVNGEYAKVTANGLESRTVAEMQSELSISVSGRTTIPLYPNFRNGNDWAFISDDEYLETLDDASTDVCYIYIPISEQLSLIGIRAEVIASWSSGGGDANAQLDIELQYLDDGGTWTTLTDFSAISATSNSGSPSVSSGIVDRTITPTLNWSTDRAYRLMFTKIKFGVASGTGQARIFNVWATL